MSRKMTARQVDVFVLLVSALQRGEPMPTQTAIAKALGLRGAWTIGDVLLRLERHGLIRCNAYCPAIVLQPAPDPAALRRALAVRRKPRPARSAVRLPKALRPAAPASIAGPAPLAPDLEVMTSRGILWCVFTGAGKTEQLEPVRLRAPDRQAAESLARTLHGTCFVRLQSELSYRISARGAG